MAELLQQLVTRQAERRPDATALVMNDERTNYAALEEASNQLARQLQAVGCVRGDRVCFLTPKRVAAIISELGILKADCIYVPMDPYYMLPSHWICFERLPQNGNGKIDRRALREQFQQSLSQAVRA